MPKQPHNAKAEAKELNIIIPSPKVTKMTAAKPMEKLTAIPTNGKTTKSKAAVRPPANKVANIAITVLATGLLISLLFTIIGPDIFYHLLSGLSIAADLAVYEGTTPWPPFPPYQRGPGGCLRGTAERSEQTSLILGAL
jgi:hypothetical protein